MAIVKAKTSKKKLTGLERRELARSVFSVDEKRRLKYVMIVYNKL